MEKTQVIIVGAGPTGLMAANLLGQMGITTLVLEQHMGLCQEARAITIDDEGLRICQAVGLANEVCNHALLNVGAYYVSRKKLLARVAPQHQRNGFPLISTFYQPEFESILLGGLERFPNVVILFGQRVQAIEQDGDGVTLTIGTKDGKTQRIQCAYVLACDGGKSAIRQTVEISLRSPQLRDLFYAPAINSKRRASGSNRRATQRWLVVDYKDHSKQREQREQHEQHKQIIFYCNPVRPAVSVQAPRERHRWEFMLKSGERDEDLLDDEIITDMVRQAEATQPEGLSVIETGSEDEHGEIERKVVYRFYASIATAFARGRIFLLGDAAHLMPPFGGQGMNSGLRDAYNLSWKLKLVIEEHASKRLLASYEQERFTHVARMIIFSALLGRLIMPTNPLLAWLRDILIHSISSIPCIQTELSEMRVKPQPRYTQGFLLSVKQSKLAGRLLPQPDVIQNGVRVRLDDVLGAGFALLRLYEKPDEAFVGIEGIKGEVWTLCKLRCVCILPPRVSDDQPSTFHVSSTQQHPSTSQHHLALQHPSTSQHHLALQQSSAKQRRPFTARIPASAGEVPTNTPQNPQSPPLVGPPFKSIVKSKRFDTIENGHHTRQDVITDTDGVLTNFLQSRQDLLVLVRPDRYIMGAFHVKHMKDVERALCKLLSEDTQA